MSSPVYLNSHLRFVSAEDVGLAHVRALERPTISKNKRYILVEGSYKFRDAIEIMKDTFKKEGYNFGYIEMPMFIQIIFLFILSLFNIKFGMGKLSYFDTSSSREDLGMRYREVNKYLKDAVYGLMITGQLKGIKK
jgi:nucleoside-diphosphate-sugar epimerase